MTDRRPERSLRADAPQRPAQPIKLNRAVMPLHGTAQDGLHIDGQSLMQLFIVQMILTLFPDPADKLPRGFQLLPVIEGTVANVGTFGIAPAHRPAGQHTNLARIIAKLHPRDVV